MELVAYERWLHMEVCLYFDEKAGVSRRQMVEMGFVK